MAQSADNIHVGPARIFVGCTPPTSAVPPTPMAHTAGVPTPGIEVGYTEGDVTFTARQEHTEINAEQSLGPVGVFTSGEVVQVSFTALEKVFEALQQAFGTWGYVNDVNRMMFYGGGSGGGVRTTCVVFTSLRPNQAGKYEVSTIYKSYDTDGFEIAYRKSGTSSYKVTFKALADGTRAMGDMLFQHYIEK